MQSLRFSLLLTLSSTRDFNQDWVRVQETKVHVVIPSLITCIPIGTLFAYIALNSVLLSSYRLLAFNLF